MFLLVFIISIRIAHNRGYQLQETIHLFSDTLGCLYSADYIRNTSTYTIWNSIDVSLIVQKFHNYFPKSIPHYFQVWLMFVSFFCINSKYVCYIAIDRKTNCIYCTVIKLYRGTSVLCQISIKKFNFTNELRATTRISLNLIYTVMYIYIIIIIVIYLDLQYNINKEILKTEQEMSSFILKYKY